MFDGRKSKIALAIFIGLVMVLTGGVLTLTSTTASAKPDIDTVKAKVDRLYHQAEIASERYNAARDRLRSSTKTLHALNSDLKRQQTRVDRMRQDVASMVVQQYQGGGLSTASHLLTSDNPDRFLDNLNAMAAYNSQRSESMSRYSVALKRLQLRKAAVKDENAALSKLRRKMAEQKAAIDKKASAAKAQLDRLQADQRRELEADDYSGPPPAVHASGSAATAVHFALAQVGKPYVYGAAGPSAYDCSGLTMAAWGAAGVGLPHSSSAQMGYGKPVSQSELQPGDLVFYYQPVSHVGMYIGNGMIVAAQNPSTGVRIVGLNSMPYSGAVRP